MTGGLTLGFTGSREAGDEHMALVMERLYLARQAGYIRLVHGCCVGADKLAMLAGRIREMEVVGIVPANRSLVVPWFKRQCHSWEEMPAGSSYRDRNARIVELADGLLALPQHSEDHPLSRRSGTWQTIRLARRKGVPIRILTLATAGLFSEPLAENPTL